MKKILTALAILAVLGLSASPAMAAFTGGAFTWNTNSLTTAGQVKLSWDGVWHGGPFTVNLVSGMAGYTLPYTTYCVESQINFSAGTTYWASVDANAYSGAAGATGDPISKTTENIFDAWQAGDWMALGLSGAGDLTTAAGKQQISEAIWGAEGEVGGSTTNATYLANYEAGNATHTMALNLWVIDDSGNATDVQSHLITVPVPGAALLGMVGFGVVGWVKRRFA